MFTPCQIYNIVNSATKQNLVAELTRILKPSYCINWQKIAASIALSRKFTVISGGPGTGKTTTVSKLLAAICELNNKDNLIIKLAAPTGKAAARLSESITTAIKEMDLDENVLKLIPSDASTIHRLLGAIHKKADFRHNKKNKLHLDVLVIDEASMVDLAMMSKLFEALPEDATLILLGDKDQLASVEAGSVLGDICSFIKEGGTDDLDKLLLKTTGHKVGISKESTNFSDSLCLLKKSYRFHKNSGIGKLAYATNSGLKSKTDATLQHGYKDIDFLELNSESYASFLTTVSSKYEEYLKFIKNDKSKEDILKSFSNTRLLCAIRESNCGLNELNNKIETLLEQNGLITRSQTSAWYIGRPIMVTKNDHTLGLYNGDIGICMRGEDNKLYVYFESQNSIRKFFPSRIPDHETIFAMTIHKSQGSEFENTFMILPNKLSPILTRELVYTGITRAKTKLTICGLRQVFNKAIANKTTRNSGLTNLLT